MHTFAAWHQTKVGLLVFTTFEAALVYVFASLAIAQGNLWYYLLTLLFLIGGLQNLIKLIGKIVFHGHKSTAA